MWIYLYTSDQKKKKNDKVRIRKKKKLKSTNALQAYQLNSRKERKRTLTFFVTLGLGVISTSYAMQKMSVINQEESTRKKKILDKFCRLTAE